VTDDIACKGEHHQDEHGEGGAHDKQGNEEHQDQDRVFQEHVEGSHNGILDFGHVARDTGHDVAFPFFGEKGKGQPEDLAVDLAADVTDHTVPDENRLPGSHVGKTHLQQGSESHPQSDQQQGKSRAMVVFEKGQEIVEVVLEGVEVDRPWHHAIDILRHVEEDLQDGDHHPDRKNSEDRREEVIEKGEAQMALVGGDVSFEYFYEILHLFSFMVAGRVHSLKGEAVASDRRLCRKVKKCRYSCGG